MPLTRENKEKIVEELESKIDKQKSILFMDFQGIKVKDLSVLRNKLKDENSEIKVSKKKLIDVALKKKNISFDTKDLSGEIAMVFGYGDEVSSSKTVYQFTKENKIGKILGGFVNNCFYGEADMIRLAELPPKEQLISNFMGTISAPASNLVKVLTGNVRELVMVISAIKEKKA